MASVILFVIYSICVNIVPAAALLPGQVCQTPNNSSGSCEDLRACGSLFNLLKKAPLAQSDREHLQHSQCGYQNRSPLVCCPREDSSPTHAPSSSLPLGIDEKHLPRPPICGATSSDRIPGGEKAEIGDFPWMALIQYSKPNNEKGFHCGGVLINENYILTASHCVNGKHLEQLKWVLSAVRLGEWDTTQEIDCEYEDDCADPVQDIHVSEAIPHEGYLPTSETQENDIALLRLERPVQYSEYIRPICLPVSQSLSLNLDGVPFSVAGWGKTEIASNSNIKLKNIVSGLPLDQCNKVYRVQNVPLGPKQLCAGGVQGFDSCRSDSGGPLMGLNVTDRRQPFWYLAGIISLRPSPCGQAGWPGVSTRVDSYIGWILEHLRI